jgi:hypothetical protein
MGDIPMKFGALLAFVVWAASFVFTSALAEPSNTIGPEHCNATGGFGLSFGSKPSGNLIGRGFGQIALTQRRPITDNGPFKEAILAFSGPQGGAFEISGTVDFNDSTQAKAAFENALAAFDRAPAFARQPAIETTAAFHADSPNSPLGYRAELAIFGTSITLTCTNSTLKRTFMAAHLASTMSMIPEPIPQDATNDMLDAQAFAQTNCNDAGAFGQEFGVRLRGPRSVIDWYHKFRLDAPLAARPFRDVYVSVTPRTKRLASGTALAMFPNVHDAARVYTDLIKAFGENSIFVRRGVDSTLTGRTGTAFYSNEDLSVGFSVFVSLAGREVRVDCSSASMFGAQLDEAFDRR